MENGGIGKNKSADPTQFKGRFLFLSEEHPSAEDDSIEALFSQGRKRQKRDLNDTEEGERIWVELSKQSNEDLDSYEKLQWSSF